MADKAHRWTDKKLKSLEKRINKEYEQAEKEVAEKIRDYYKRYETKDKKWRSWVRQGVKTEKEYQEWRTGQLAVGEQWERIKEELAADYHNANNIAKKIAYDTAKNVYAENYNYSTYEIEKGLELDTNFTLYSRDTIERILRDDPSLLPEPGKKVSSLIAAGLDMRWNKQIIQSAVIQGILQGESIPKIATRLAASVGDKNRKAAIRNARTMITGAQNAGRVESYKRAQRMGIDLKQQWVATLDGRTRHEHRLLDGQTVKVGEPFHVEGMTIRFPGDPTAPARLVYNCRCTLISQLKGFEIDATKYRQDPDLGGMSYEEWKHAKESKSNPITLPEEKAENIKQSYINQYRGFGTGSGNNPSIRYGNYRDVSFDDDDLRSHMDDGSDLDPIKMVMNDTGFSKERAKQAISDTTSWVGSACGKIRRREGDYSEVADRIEEFIDASPKYRGTIYRGISVESDECLKILDEFDNIGAIDQRGISSWSTDMDFATEFADMTARGKTAPVKIVFQIDDNETGVSIRHIADIDNYEVIQSGKIKYEKVGDIERVNDPYIGEYYLIRVKEIYG